MGGTGGGGELVFGEGDREKEKERGRSLLELDEGCF